MLFEKELSVFEFSIARMELSTNKSSRAHGYQYQGDQQITSGVLASFSQRPFKDS